MGVDAASGWILGELEYGQPIPHASPQEAIKPEPGSFVNLLALDIDEYAKKYGTKVVRKNVTIPAWLNTFAESQHINFSQALLSININSERRQNANSLLLLRHHSLNAPRR